MYTKHDLLTDKTTYFLTSLKVVFNVRLLLLYNIILYSFKYNIVTKKCLYFQYGSSFDH